MRDKYFLPIAALFTATLLISNTLDTKIFMLFGLSLPAGIILFPLAYLFGDILTEIYGYALSRRVIWSSVAALLLMLASYEMTRALPAAPFWPNQSAFDAVLSQVPRIATASMSAFLCGEFTNSYVLAKLKVRTGGSHMWLRFVLSTLAGQFVDTILFVAIAFTGTFPASDLAQIALSAWAVKVAWEIVALPGTLPLVRKLKRAENQDYFDSRTDFNPFKLGE